MSRPALRARFAAALITAACAIPAYADSKIWTGQWIWDRPAVSEQNAYNYFVKSVPLTGKPQSAVAYVSADSRYQLYVNGYFIHRGPARSNQVNQAYDSYDISPYLGSGTNIIAAVVVFWGVGNEQYILGQGGFLFECNIVPSSGPSVLVNSDATWKVLRSPSWNPSSPRENSSNGFTEIFDFGQEPANWKKGQNTQNWGVPVVIGAPPIRPWVNMTARDIPFPFEKPIKPSRVISTNEVQRTVPTNPLWVALQIQYEKYMPVSSVSIINPQYLVTGTGSPTTVTTPVSGRDAVILLDFGREQAGFPNFSASGPPGAIIDVAFSEWLLNGQVVGVRSSQVVCGKNAGPPMFTADRVILGSGPATWQRFSYTGFRYVQLTIRNATQPVTITSAGASFTAYPFAPNGSFTSSDTSLNSIWNMSAYTLLLTTYDAFVDCPWREKGQWLDMSAPMASYYAFGNQQIAARYLRTTSQSQNSQGRMFFPYPSSFAFELPGQEMWWGMHLWQYYLHFGDITLLQQLYPALAQQNTWFQQNLSQQGLLNASWPDDAAGSLWNWVDWGERPTKNYPVSCGGFGGQVATIDMLYYGYLTSAANVALALGIGGDAQQFQQQAQALETAINNNYWDPVSGFYWDDVGHTIKGNQASVLAVLYGIAPPGQVQAILNNVSANQFGGSSPSFYFFILQALSQAGMNGAASQAIRSQWGLLQSEGASSVWELWNPNLSSIGTPFPPGFIPSISLAHNYGTSPLYFLSSRVLGIQPTGPGFSTYGVSPDSSSVQWANGTVPTPNGSIAVNWSAANAGTFTLALTSPMATVGSVVLPRMSTDTITAGGQVVWQNGAAAVAMPPGLSVAGSTAAQVTIQAQTGNYSFVSQ